MIRRVRGAEPTALTRERRWRVARGILYPDLRDTMLGYNLPAVRQTLHRIQRGQCAYCSQPVEASFNDIEHFRPRAQYWWLTWTWENLWLACAVCQAKSDAFALAAGHRLAEPDVSDLASAFQLCAEQPMLLDPARDEPEKHLCFVPVSDIPGAWFWAPQAGSERGKATCEALRLSRFHHERMGQYDRTCEHLRRRIIPFTQHIRTLLPEAVGSHEALQGAWETAWRDFLWQTDTAQADYLLASWWYLSVFFTENRLSEYGLHMWPYPDNAAGALPSAPPPLDADTDLPTGLDSHARLHVLYVRSTDRVTSAAHREAAVLAICGCLEARVSLLASLLGLSQETIQATCRDLLANNRLQRRQDPSDRRVLLYRSV